MIATIPANAEHQGERQPVQRRLRDSRTLGRAHVARASAVPYTGWSMAMRLFVSLREAGFWPFAELGEESRF